MMCGHFSYSIFIITKNIQEQKNVPRYLYRCSVLRSLSFAMYYVQRRVFGTEIHKFLTSNVYYNRSTSFHLCQYLNFLPVPY